jgi:hypothetical protein
MQVYKPLELRRMGEQAYSSTHTNLGTNFKSLAERAPGTHWLGGCVGPRVGLEAVVKTKTSAPVRESELDSLVIKSAA